MNIFIDAVSSEAHLILFDNKKIIKDNISWHIKWQESSTIITKLDKFLIKNNISYENLDNIFVVNGPGSFTWIRTIVLIVNTINFIIKKNIIPISYFDLFSYYPIIKSSSKNDCFVKFDKKSKIEIITNENILKKLKKDTINKIFWDFYFDTFKKQAKENDIKIVEKVDYSDIISNIDINHIKKYKEIKPLYVKEPNIS